MKTMIADCPFGCDWLGWNGKKRKKTMIADQQRVGRVGATASGVNAAMTAAVCND